MRSYAAAYKMCGDVSSAEAQRDGPIVLCWPTRSLTTAISCIGREPVLPQETGVSSYMFSAAFITPFGRYQAGQNSFRTFLLAIVAWSLMVGLLFWVLAK
jgi:hypothetical protein